jgi:hypothetical protein
MSLALPELTTKYAHAGADVALWHALFTSFIKLFRHCCCIAEVLAA